MGISIARRGASFVAQAFIAAAVLTALVVIAMPRAAQAQYSSHASAASQQGIFIYRVPGQPNLMIPPRQGLSAASQQGAFIYRNGAPGGAFSIAPRPSAALSPVVPVINGNSPNLGQQGVGFNAAAGAAAGFDPVAGAAAGAFMQGAGVVDRVNPSSLVVMSAGKQFLVKPDPMASIEVKGTATSDFLKAGQMVKFTSAFNDDGEAMAPLSQLAVVSLRRGEKAGATPDQPTTAKADKVIRSASASDDEEKLAASSGSSEKGSTGDAGSPIPLNVLGRINSISGNQLLVGTGSGNYKVVLDPDAKIDVNMADLSLIQPGDKVTVGGRLERPGVAAASVVQVTLAKPLGGKKVAAAR